MKTIILIIAVLFSFGAKAQLSADSVLTKVHIKTEFMLIDTFTEISSGNIDTLMYFEVMQKKDLPFKKRKMFFSSYSDTTYTDSVMILTPQIDTIYRLVKYIPPLIVPNNDTIYKRADSYKLDYLRSLKIVRYRLVRKYVEQKIEKPINLQMSDLAKKRFNLNYDINLFWDHPKVIKAITDE